MATYAVIMYGLGTCLLNLDNLRLAPQGEDCGMPQAIHGFEKVVAGQIVVRNVAVVAVCVLAVSAVVPC